MRGFTLIETLIYIALYTLIIGGVVVSVYSIIESSNRNQAKAMLHEEGLFILGKLESSLANADNALTPDPATLSITDNSLSSSKNPTVFSVASGNLSVTRGNSPSEILNNSNVTVTNSSFVYTTQSGDGVLPEKVEISFTFETATLNGTKVIENFSTTKYLRK